MSEFTSAFAPKIDAMLAYRTARGFKEETSLLNLLQFDGFCAEHYPEADKLTSEIVWGWLGEETSAEVRSFTSRSSTIRQFGLYLNAVHEDAYVLPEKLRTRKPGAIPYNFTDDELTALFTEIDRLPANPNEPFLTEIAPVLFRLTYTCGLRPNEGREMLTENVNLDTGEIVITNTKRGKDRIVVMSDDMLGMCRRYNARRGIFGGGSLYFFPAKGGSAFTSAKIFAAFNRAWTAAVCSPQNPVPPSVRVYDLRHRFASARLNRWLDDGCDLFSMLPYLREYMGHHSLNETAYYIHILPENLMKSSAVDWAKFNAMFAEVRA
jgi:integrase